MQPVAGSQESSVQAFPSSQLIGRPEQLPPEQTSPAVQALLSLHFAEFGVFTQPLKRLQESSVHGLLSSQVIKAWRHCPVLELQVSLVHAFRSSQLMGMPEQRPPEMVSPAVQGSPSSQAALSSLSAYPAVELLRPNCRVVDVKIALDGRDPFAGITERFLLSLVWTALAFCAETFSPRFGIPSAALPFPAGKAADTFTALTFSSGIFSVGDDAIWAGAADPEE
jgi:hypothetical protein